MNATLYNLGRSDHPTRRPGSARASVRSILIVGGGTAGWMTALTLARALDEQQVDITVVESPTVGVIGVGEGSTPWLRGFFDSLDIEEREWMPACHATYKCGITFDKWSRKPGFASYFHPFASMLDNLTMTQFVHNADARVGGADVDAHPDRYFIATRLARSHRAPKAPEHFPFDVWHGYHFDAILLGQFLQKKAVQRGVRYRAAHVLEGNLDAAGGIASVTLADGGRIQADIFVDCSGFAGLLIERTLHTPFVSFADNLFNDAAVAIATPVDPEQPLPSETVATALSAGWAWKIPLTSRFGNGYVYSSRYCSPDTAEIELRRHLGVLDSAAPARHLSMKVGRRTQHWNKNCVAIGLSQGFIEPLEATALLFIQQTAAAFAQVLQVGELTDAAHEAFNDTVNAHFEGIRDYIVAHYKTSSRTDSDYWRDNSANLHLSDSLKQLLSLWMSGRGIASPVRQQVLGKGYPVFSWYALLAGMGIFPDQAQLHPPRGKEGQYRLGSIDDLLERSLVNYRDHRAILGDIPARRSGDSLQLYLW